MRLDIYICIAALLAAVIAAASPVSRAERIPFDVSGRVILVNNGDVPQIYLSTERGIFQCWNCSGGDGCIKPGSRLRLLGYDDPAASGFPTRFATNITVVSHAPAPFDPDLVSARSLLAGDCKDKPVAVAGVVVSVLRDDIDSQWNWLVLNTDAGHVHAAVTENTMPLESLRSLPDAEVVLRGVATKISRCRAFLKNIVFASGVNGLSVKRPAPANPFAAARIGETNTLHRQVCSGHVIGHGRGLVFMTTSGGRFLPVFLASGVERPQIGAAVTVSGFASDGQTGLQLTEALVRVDPGMIRERADPIRLSASDLFTDDSGHDLANFNYASKVISIRGEVDSSMESHRATGVAFLDVAGRRISVDLTNVLPSLPPDFGHGYEIDAAGICYAEFDNSPSLTFPFFKGFTIYPRDATDITIVKRPSWWTMPRLLVLVGILAVTLVAVFIWNRALRILSVRHGRELAREQLRHAKSNLKVEERTKLAVELHDSISQTLVGVALQIETALSVSGADKGPARRFLVTARQMLESCRQELKGCLWDLRSRTFEERDMSEMIRRTVAAHTENVSVAIRFDIPRETLSEYTAHNILRIVRELVVNAVRHGKARRIRIAGEASDGMIRFSVRDDGTGFVVSAAEGPAQGHFGLQGVRERAKKMGGSAEVISEPGKGTKVTVTLKELHA